MLSTLESRLLAAHVRVCSGCAEYADRVEQTTRLLRKQPLLPRPTSF